MAAPLGFGTFIPANTLVHNLNAQVKIVLACAFSIAAFFVESWPGMGVLCVAVTALYVLARLRVGHALAGLKPVAFILTFTVVVHAFGFGLDAGAAGAAGASGAGGGSAAAASQSAAAGVWVIAGGFGVTLAGLETGAFLALRIALLVAACSLLTFTTSQTALTDGLVALLRPLARLHVPVDDIAAVVSMALRFIPTTAQEAQRVVQAQKARGAEFDGGGLLARTRAWIPVFVPLFVRLFRRADDLAMAMDARCYQGAGRTRLRSVKPSTGELVAAGAMLALLAGVCVVW